MFTSKVKKAGLYIAGIYAFFFIGFAIAYFIQYITESNLNNYVVQTSIEYIYAVIWSFIIAASIYFWKIPDDDKKILVGLWAVRVVVVLTAMVYYEKKYVLDAFVYFKEGLEGNYSYSLFGFSGSDTVVALISTLTETLPMMTSFHSLKIIWSLVGLISIYITYKAYVLHYGENKKVLYTLGLFPSILFWSSTLGKDAIVLFGISMCLYGCLSLLKNFSVKSLVIVAIGLMVIFQIRFWISLTIGFAAVSAFLLTSERVKNKFVPLMAFGAAFYVSYGYFIEKMKLFTMEEFFDKTTTVSRGWSYGGSGALEVPEFNSLADIIRFLPLGIFTAVFRPMPGEVNNIFGIFSGIENFLLLYIVIRVIAMSKLKETINSATVYLFAFVLSWSFLYSTISYQNLGTAVRFKLQILPAMVILIFAMSNKIKKKDDELSFVEEPKYKKDKVVTNLSSDDIGGN